METTKNRNSGRQGSLPLAPPPAPKPVVVCEYCGRGRSLTTDDIQMMSKDDVVTVAHEHGDGCEFVNTYIRPLLGDARNVRGP